ncbi:hypothetical protein [Mucilaginibacter puniceus]
MNFFKIKTAWSNAEFIPLKLCVASAYVLIGSYFHAFIKQYTIPIIIVFIVTCVWCLYLWLGKMKKAES